MAKSGCIAVTGGLEVASDRLLAKMKKGVDIAKELADSILMRGKLTAKGGVAGHSQGGIGSHLVASSRSEINAVVDLQGAVLCAGCANGHGCHRIATRHLQNGIEAIDPGKRFGLHGHANDRNTGFRCHHAGQMRRAACACDDHLKAA